MSYNKYNNIRRLQISDQNFTFQSKSNFDDAFITKFLDTYKRYLQLLSPNFFTSTATIEIQNNIIRNNFGEDIDINSFRETAFQQQVTAQIYAFFIHIAAHSALEALDPLVPSILAQGAEDYVELQEAKSKSKKKKKNKKEKSKSEKEIIDSDDAPEEPIRNSLDDTIFEDDHEIGTNTNHAEQSGTKSSNDQQPMEIVNDIPEVQDNQLQDDQQPVNNNSNKTKSSNKKNKSKKNEVLKVLTGYTPTDTSQVRDILVYDIPVSWTAEKILQDLTLWGKTISINSKRQKKYQTVRIKIDLSSFRFAQFEANQNPAWTTDLGGIPVRWFPARWNLKERKQREKFQATLHKIPDSMTMATLWKESRPHSTLSGVKGLKSFKIIQTARGDRKLIGYFEKWEDMHYALDNQFVWESQKLTWKRHDPPKQQWKSLQKTERISRNQQQNQQNSKNSKKKPQETKSQKSKKTDKKKDKSRKASRSKILAEILDTLRKLV